MLDGNIDDVEERADNGIISPPNDTGGLPVPDIPDNEAPDTEGDSEYARPPLERGGTLRGADKRFEDDVP